MPLDKNLKWLTFQLSKTSKSIAEVLMDQGIFSGVGNYIRAEALYLCKLSPWRQANKLSQDEIKALCQACMDVMQESYQHQGATIHTYKTVYGEEGKYSTLFKVYGQKQDPEGRKIIKQATPDKRTIHWCPEIQV
jgi:formamidopyrimidine-DNA glycosylase